MWKLQKKRTILKSPSKLQVLNKGQKDRTSE